MSKTRHDLGKLPKWAQDYIQELAESKAEYNTGAKIESVHIENIGVKHSDDAMRSMVSIANAVESSNQVLLQLAKALTVDGNSIEFGHAINLTEVKGK